MKPSHLKTPRSMDECNFMPGYKCWEREPSKAVELFLALAALALVIMAVAGWLPGGKA